jgi:hypothetical protein
MAHRRTTRVAKISVLRLAPGAFAIHQTMCRAAKALTADQFLWIFLPDPDICVRPWLSLKIVII